MFAIYRSQMDTDHIEALYARARKLRVPIYRVCAIAGVNKSTLSCWRTGNVEPKTSTLARVESALRQMEEAKGEQYVKPANSGD